MTPSDLKRARDAMGMRQVDMAAALSCAAGTISTWETGAAPIPYMAGLAVLWLMHEHRTNKKPRKSPFWWVVKLRDGRYVYADDEFTQYASAARPFTHRSDAEDCAISCPYDARVVRVRARGGQ